jgi:hypothetical protein
MDLRMSRPRDHRQRFACVGVARRARTDLTDLTLRHAASQLLRTEGSQLLSPQMHLSYVWNPYGIKIGLVTLARAPFRSPPRTESANARHK